MIVTPNVDLHLHLEGSLPVEAAVRLARQIDHPWGLLTPRELKRTFRYASFSEFIDRIRDMCRVIASPGGLGLACSSLSLQLAAEGVRYAEVYVSPFIYMRWGATWKEVVHQCEEGFAMGEDGGGAHCAVLLDTVRQLEPGAGHAILDAWESEPWQRAVGFGIGGEESVPLARFADVFERARSLGLRTVAHAGEGSHAGDVRDAIEVLQVDRVAHGIRAVSDPGLLADLSHRGTPLDVAVSSNYRTRVVTSLPHPLRPLIDAGIRVSLGTDDPSLFRTSMQREVRVARRAANLTESEIRQLARNAIDNSFAPDSLKASLHRDLTARRRTDAGEAPLPDRGDVTA